MVGRLIEWCRRHLIRVTFIMAGIESIAFFVWWHLGGEGIFASLASYIFICLGIFIASSASLYSLFSSINANASLEATRVSIDLTRRIQRPFLNVCQFGVNWSRSDGQPASVKYFIVGLCNTGVFPADQISVIMKVSEYKIDDQQHSFVASEGVPTICFPSDDITNILFQKLDEKEKLEVELKSQLKARIEIEYINKLTQETHKINRSYLVQYNPTAQREPTPLPNEDYWD